MNISEETANRIEELQVFEQNFQNILLQKQSFQIELNEVNNASEELKKSGDEVYKVISGIMIKSDKKNLLDELAEKKKLLEMRISSVEKQEKLVENRIKNLKKEISDAVSEKKS